MDTAQSTHTVRNIVVPCDRGDSRTRPPIHQLLCDGLRLPLWQLGRFGTTPKDAPPAKAVEGWLFYGGGPGDRNSYIRAAYDGLLDVTCDQADQWAIGGRQIDASWDWYRLGAPPGRGMPLVSSARWNHVQMHVLPADEDPREGSPRETPSTPREAAKRIQAYWRACVRERTMCLECEQGSASESYRWDSARTRRLGALEAHVRFLQYFFRATKLLRTDSWCRGRLRAPAMCTRLLWRRSPLRRCQGGANLASPAEFEAQRDLSGRMLAWYGLYVMILRRLESGETPSVVSLFCGGGGDMEGKRRAGGTGIGVDATDQPEFRRRFGDEAFMHADATSWASVAKARDKSRAFGAMGGPPCQFYSTIRIRGESSSPPLIDATRDMMRALFDKWSIENVPGARSYMKEPAELRGSDFGLRTDRPRLFESNFHIGVDRSVRAAGDALRARCCQGERRRWRSRDTFGRPSGRECCAGNTFALQGTSPWRCTQEQCAEAMGLDVGHMSYERIAQSVPPAYGRLVYSQMCMARAGSRFGVPAISFDEMLADPAGAKRTMARWLRGAGDERPEAALELVSAKAAVERSRASGVSVVSGGATRGAGIDTTDGSAFRELYYSHAGAFDQLYSSRVGEGLHHPLAEMRPHELLERLPTAAVLAGKNTLIETSASELKRAAAVLFELVKAGAPGTRVTVRVKLKHESWMRRNGFVPVSLELHEMTSKLGFVYLCAGRRGGGSSESFLDHDWADSYMDPRDRGEGVEPGERKEVRSWTYYPHDPEQWDKQCLHPSVRELMTSGAVIDLLSDLPPGEVRQYPFPTVEAQAECLLECDRALATGHMEYVPDDQVRDVLRDCVIHPWLIVQQGPKWRACHDYSVGTNRSANTAPFNLPTTWDVRRLVKPTSRFCKYDLRDGFWAVPVEKASRRRLCMRHPGTGRLMQCARLPFGFLDSPRLFCSVSEAMAAEFRKRVAGKGIHILCFVDDYLIVGDNEELTQEGGAIFESLLFEFGLQWAPHKQRGPCACIEFLGLLICNVEGARCIALTRSRQGKLRRMIDEWLTLRREHRGRRQVQVKPRDLAVLLGHLIFGSQVVPGGRTYMQGMLSQFKGLTVDWNHGQVKLTVGGEWGLVSLGDDFWRDLDWWADHFERRNCASLEERKIGVAAITGTDASDWGTGQLVWLNGAREEVVLQFTEVEQRRSINWRELLGIVRIIEHFGPRLSGRHVLVETDNTSARGAAAKLSSTSQDMQELVRRLLEAAERYGVSVRFTHTPGVKLIRPDQTSRGDPVEEPRMRLDKRRFELLNARFGPFNEFLGAERDHAVTGVSSGEGPRIWMHPTFTTVASALRLLGTRMAKGDGASGIAVVPWHKEAAWWGLTRHFRVVGRIAAGEGGLEAMHFGMWRPMPFPRDMLILAFPRGAGSIARPIWLEPHESGHESTWGNGYVLTCDQENRALPLAVGSFVYSPGLSPMEHGVLYMVWKQFAPYRPFDEQIYLTEEDAMMCVQLAQLTRSYSVKGKAKSKTFDTAGGKLKYTLNLQRSADVADRAFAPGIGYTPWSVSAGMLWSVDHLVKELTPEAELDATSPGAGGLLAKRVAGKTFSFDFKLAEREIAAGAVRRANVGQEYEAFDASGLVTPGSDARSAAGPAGSASPASDQGMESIGYGLRRVNLQRTNETVESPDRMERRIRAGLRAAREETRAPKSSDSEKETQELAQVLAPTAEAEAEAELKAAQLSAEEALAARTRPAVTGGARGGGKAAERPPSIAEEGLQRNRYAGTRCEGCKMPIELNALLRQGGRGVCHDAPACVAIAERELTEAIQLSQTELGGAKAQHTELDSKKREAQMKHRFSAEHCRNMRECVEGKCSARLKEPQEARLMCSAGCGRGVHVVSCLMMSKHRTARGSFKCGNCRAAEIAPFSCRLEDNLIYEGDQGALLELTTGAEGTAAGHAEFARLERLWLGHVAARQAGVPFSDFVLPRHGLESFISFLRWLVTDAGRARSFVTIVRSAAGVLAADPALTNWTTLPRVKAIVKELSACAGVTSVPDSHATRRILSLMYEAIDRTLATALQKRTRVLADLEVLGGVRIGEACEGTGCHNAISNHLCIMRKVGTEVGDESESCELFIEDSKTYYSRYSNFIGKSKGVGIEAARHIRELWAEMGIKVETTVEDGLIVERPDYWVLRVSMADMNDDMYKKLRKATAACEIPEVAKHAKASLGKMQSRRAAETTGEEQKYINVAGGPKSSKALTDALRYFESKGLGHYVDKVPGPLLRATHGSVLTHMPLKAESSYTHLMGALKEAWNTSSRLEEPDEELDLEGLEKPKWGHHTFRRTADKFARQYMQETGTSKEDIDDMFGWKQAERSKDMQKHYDVRRNRSRRAAITMMI